MELLEINYPKSRDEITLNQYQTYLKYVNASNDDEIPTATLFKIFTDVDIRNLKNNDAERILSHIENSLKQCETYNGFEPIFEFEGVEYGFIPNLDDMSFGEYEDLCDTLNEVNSFNNAMEILYRPITKRTKDIYDIEIYQGYKNKPEYKRMPVTYFLGALVFFYHLISALSTHTKIYSIEAMNQMKTKLKHLETEHQKIVSIKNGHRIANI